jgi:poly(3-hydroxyalkanoate) synthetase
MNSKPTKDPKWLIEMKKEADKLNIPLRELLTQNTKKKAPAKKPAAGKKKTVMAAKGGYMTKKKKK